MVKLDCHLHCHYHHGVLFAEFHESDTHSVLFLFKSSRNIQSFLLYHLKSIDFHEPKITEIFRYYMKWLSWRLMGTKVVLIGKSTKAVRYSDTVESEIYCTVKEGFT